MADERVTMSESEYKRSIWYQQINRRRLLEMGGKLTVAGMMFPSVAGAALSGATAEEIIYATLEADANPKSLAGFKKSGITVKPQLVKSSSETLAKLVTGNSGIDVMLDFNGHGALTYKAGVITPLNVQKIPRIKKILPNLRSKTSGAIWAGKRYGTIADWGTDSLAYVHKDGVGKKVDSISILFDPKYKGKIAMPANYFESIYVGALRLGYTKPYDLTPAQLAKVTALLIKQKPLVRVYWDAIGNLKNLFATGEIVAAWSWAPVLQVKEENKVDIRWVNPKEGQLLFYNTHYLTKEAIKNGNEDNALAFMDYLLSPEYFVPLAEQYQYRPSTIDSIKQLSPALRHKLYLDDPHFLDNSKIFDAPTRPDAYQKAWDKIVNA